jgi:hypothetical protein
MLALVAWVTKSSARLVCGLGPGVEDRAAAPESAVALWSVVSGHLGGGAVGLVGAWPRG